MWSRKFATLCLCQCLDSAFLLHVTQWYPMALVFTVFVFLILNICAVML